MRGVSGAARGVDAALGGDADLLDAVAVDPAQVPRLAWLVEAARRDREAERRMNGG